MTQVELSSTTCAECGVVFAMPATMLAARRESKETSWCPNGHSLSFKKSTSERLREELDSTRTRLRAQVDTAYGYAKDAADERDRLRRSNASLRGALTKVRQRRDSERAS